MKKRSIPELQRVEADAYQALPKLPAVILLDNVRSLNNVGSVFRTADAFLAEKIILAGITGTPPHREIHKTALGATDTVAWEYCETPEQAILPYKNRGYQVVAVEQAEPSVQLQAFRPRAGQGYVFVFGNEIHGVSDSLLPFCDFALEIPQYGTKHSLNIAVTAGIVLWAYASAFL